VPKSYNTKQGFSVLVILALVELGKPSKPNKNE
jgi:hypothetical protein